MNRSDLQALANLREREATILLNNGCFEGAYYLLGYAVECALKACFAKQIREYDFPDKKLIENVWSHDLKRLLELAGLKAEFDAEVARERQFELNWNEVKDWKESDRYERSIPEPKVRSFFSAVQNPTSGVLPWL